MINFDNVTLIYPYVQRTIFENLSFEVPEGEFVLIMGDTGVGKSTLLKLMNGLVPHHTGGIFSGTISIDGRDTALQKPRDLVDLTESFVNAAFDCIGGFTYRTPLIADIFIQRIEGAFVGHTDKLMHQIGNPKIQISVIVEIRPDRGDRMTVLWSVVRFAGLVIEFLWIVLPLNSQNRGLIH